MERGKEKEQEKWTWQISREVKEWRRMRRRGSGGKQEGGGEFTEDVGGEEGENEEEDI